MFCTKQVYPNEHDSANSQLFLKFSGEMAFQDSATCMSIFRNFGMSNSAGTALDGDDPSTSLSSVTTAVHNLKLLTDYIISLETRLQCTCMYWSTFG